MLPSGRVTYRWERRSLVDFHSGCCLGLALKLKLRLRLSSQSEEWSLRLIVGTGKALILTRTESPRRSVCRCLPSNATDASSRASSGTKQRRTTWSGKTMDRKDKTCGQIGVTRMHGTAGWTTEDPAASEYAVEPVGVAKMTPSA